MDLPAQISALSIATRQGFDILKILNSADKALDTASLKIQVLELTNRLVEAQASLIQTQNEVSAKDAEILKLKASFEERSELVTGWEGYKYKKDQNGNQHGYPACPTCESTGRITFLVPNGDWKKGKCPACKEEFSPIYPYNSDGEREEKERRDRINRPVNATRAGDWMA